MSQLKRSLYLLRMSSGCPSPKYNELNDRTNIPVDFSDTRKAFRSKTTWELLRHYFVFSAFKFEVVISRSRQVFDYTLVVIFPSYLFSIFTNVIMQV